MLIFLINMFTIFKNWKVTEVFSHFKWPWWLKKNSQYFFFTLAVNLYKQLHYTYGHLGEWHLTFLAAESFVVLVCQQPTEVVRGGLRLSESASFFLVVSCGSPCLSLHPTVPASTESFLLKCWPTKFLKRNQWVLIYPWSQSVTECLTWVVSSTN